MPRHAHVWREKNMRRNICSKSWPQARNSTGVCNYSLSTAVQLASFKSLRPSQNQHTSPSTKWYLTSLNAAKLSLLFTSHLVSVTYWSEFCLMSTWLDRFLSCFSQRCSSTMNHQWACCSLGGCRVEMKQTVPRVFKMVATAIKVEERSSGCGCFCHHSRSLPAIVVTYVCPAV